MLPNISEGAGSRSDSPSRTDPIVRTRDLSVEFDSPDGAGTRAVLKGVDITIPEGELVVLVGKSGCGKTTLLNVLASLESDYRGTVEIVGRPPERALDSIAYMFARDALLPCRTARRNVEFALELRRPHLSRRDRRSTAQAYLEMAGLGHAARMFPWQLSQGMRQRVALARTWAVEPALLLMDEPFAALDAQTREEVQDQFLTLWTESKRTVVFVTHDLVEAVLLGDRVLVLADGQVVEEVQVDIPRPRCAETVVELPQFRSVHQRLVAAIKH